MSASEISWNPADVDRFWSKADRSDNCWLWQGNRTTNGYGIFWLAGRNRLAHRVAVEMESGPIADGLQIDHLCRVRNCVRPDHLEATTPQINTLRGRTRAAANAAKSHCLHGHPYDEENTGLERRAGRISRVCRACNRDRWRRYSQQRKARAAGEVA